MPAARKRDDDIDDVGIGRNFGHLVVGAEDILRNPRFDGEAHFLRHALLLRVDADVAIDDEVPHENGIADLACLGGLLQFSVSRRLLCQPSSCLSCDRFLPRRLGCRALIESHAEPQSAFWFKAADASDAQSAPRKPSISGLSRARPAMSSRCRDPARPDEEIIRPRRTDKFGRDGPLERTDGQAASGFIRRIEHRAGEARAASMGRSESQDRRSAISTATSWVRRCFPGPAATIAGRGSSIAEKADFDDVDSRLPP